MKIKFSPNLLLLPIFVLASLLFPILHFVATVSTVQGTGTVVRVEPEKVTMGPEPAVGQQFKIEIIVEDVEDLYGWEVELFWDSSLLNCTEEEYPILPEGLDWEDPNNLLLGLGIEQEYNATHGRWYRGLTALPITAPFPQSFYGTMKLALLTFEVIYQPYYNGSCVFKLSGKLADTACGIHHRDVDGYYEILSYPAPTLEPRLEIKPGSLKTFTDDVFDVDVTIGNVAASVMLVGVEFKLRYNTTMLSVVDATEGPFMQDPSWAMNEAVMAGPFIEDDYVVLAILTLPGMDGEWTAFPEGGGTLATITFNATAVGNCALELFDTKLANPDLEPISHTTAKGFVTVTEAAASPDVNGDGVVDVLDIVAVAPALGSYPGHSRWNPVADVSNNDVVDIFDLILIATNFNQVGYESSPDVNGDEIVDIYDVVTVATAFGSQPGELEWDQLADVQFQDGLIDIFDLAAVARYFGASWPQTPL